MTFQKSQVGELVLCWDKYDRTDAPVIGRYVEYDATHDEHRVNLPGGVTTFKEVRVVNNLVEIYQATECYIP